MSSSDSQAIRPTSTVFSVDEQVEEKVNERKDTSLGELQYHEGWQQVRQLIESRIAEYKSGQLINVTGKEDFEEIGRKFLVSSAVAGELEGILGQVDAAASIEQDGTE